MRPAHLLLAPFALLAASACGSDEPAQQLEIAGGERGAEMWFEPADPTVEPGRYELVFDNVGSVHHELAVLDPDGAVLAAASTAGRTTVSFEVDLSAPGRYDLVCREPGHAQAGMVGTLTVE